jgi:phosphoglycerate dehydrogenase-like enzyme
MKIVGGVFSVPSWTLPAVQVDRIRAALPHAEVAHATTADELLREIGDADAALLTRIDPAQFAAATRLRWIHSAAAGVGRLLLPEVRRSNVVVTNSRGIHGATMAEHVIGVVIALLRDLPATIRRQARHEWAYVEISSIKTLRGRHMVVVGLGAIGSEVARSASALGMHVSAVRRHPDFPRPACVESVHGPGELGEVLPRADVVVLAAPLTPETRALIGSRELALMKPTAILVNVARGKLVDEKTLVEELVKGTIAGAALDVFEHEPLDPSSPLWDLPNALITPHTSGYREDYWGAVVDIFIDNARRFEAGQPLINVVDKDRGY